MKREREIELILIGLNVEINKIQNKIREGEKILFNRKIGIKDKSPLSNAVIKKRIAKLKKNLDLLDKEKFDFEYELH